MPSVLDRSALEQSPLADLHLLANELGVDGFRRLRKPDLVDAILSRQSGEPVESADPAEPEVEAEAAVAVAEDDQPKRSRRGRRGGRGRKRDEDGDDSTVDRDEPVAAPSGNGERSVEGAVELLANGSGFLRLSPDGETDDDVYISAAQVKRCELVSGDRVTGPVRAARRSERYPSLIRVDTINGRPAEEVAEGTRFEELAVAWPSQRIELGSEDATVKAIEWLTPFGRGSRVVIAGPSRSGKSEAVRRLAEALVSRGGLEVSAVLIGVRPEETADFPVTPGAALTFAASVDAQAQAVEQAVEVGRRVAARGGDAVVLIDTLEYLPAAAARRALAAGRNLASGGSLTVIATAPEPIGGETTVVVLDRALAAAGTFPALALSESGTLRPELLVGQAGTDAIREAGGGAEVSVPEPVAVVAEPELPVEAPKAKAKATPKPKAEAKPKPKAEAKPKPKAEAEPKPKAKAKAEAKKKPAAKKTPAPAAKPEPAAAPEAPVPAAKPAAAEARRSRQRRRSRRRPRRPRSPRRRSPQPDASAPPRPSPRRRSRPPRPRSPPRVSGRRRSRRPSGPRERPSGRSLPTSSDAPRTRPGASSARARARSAPGRVRVARNRRCA